MLLPGNTDCFSYLSKTTVQPIYLNHTCAYADGKKDASEPEEKRDASVANRYMMLMPTPADLQTGSYTIEVDYLIEDSVPLTAKVNLPEDWKFESGKAYEFLFHVSTTQIGFEVQVTPWVEHFGTGDDISDYTQVHTLTPIVQ